ncbi:hypothetical protein 65p187 [Aeromonas phage 65]|uniref:Uncharacterized protein n=2 Tax=Ishigurovirus osborne TaxID=260149 RepID=A0A219YCA7_9CAUD|nr:hypothetical protein ST65p187 [Aeromonas phage 65]ADQ53195.1 hypothetical protein 65p187 [Aeromonas phage 65]APU01572.1 hypothetical protein [Aeromonas phage 65.2]
MTNNEILNNQEFGQMMTVVESTPELKKQLSVLVHQHVKGATKHNQILSLVYGTNPDLAFKFSASRYVRVTGAIHRNRKCSIGYITQMVYEELEKYEKFLKKPIAMGEIF